ncbi:hypothetical protein HNQ80_004597 [Anaerosolibacter carboniphilus]|uniref:Uncharacterized protein n=1 Tax=Anaerosolibacter carboniphilus TaxID=1417629 RepID=A0A841KYM0_9FIRM|nr:hypothetical protein [Anaerosolibacter carboniphilus]
MLGFEAYEVEYFNCRSDRSAFHQHFSIHEHVYFLCEMGNMKDA